MELTHLDENGRASMVDVSDKETTKRVAIARGFVKIRKEVLDTIASGKVNKGDVLSVAQIAGITAAKKTGDLIPLCHPLGLDHVSVDLLVMQSGVQITASATTSGKTGVEMEALTAVTVAALTVYDMCKAADREMVIDNIMLLEKSGGRSGHFVRSESK